MASRRPMDPRGSTWTAEELLRFREAMDVSGDAIYLVDRTTMRFIDVNETACRRMGYARGEVLSMGPHDLLSVSREALEKAYDEVIAAGPEGITTESSARYRDGRLADAEMHRCALRRGDSWIIVSIARDITRSKQAMRGSRRIGRMFAALSATNEAILRARQAGELYQQVCEAAVVGGKFISTSVFVPEADAPVLKAVAIAGKGKELLSGVRIPVDGKSAGSNNLIGIGYLSGEPCVSNDYLADPRTTATHAMAGAAGVRAGAAIPVLRGGQAAGVLLIYSEEKDVFDDEIVRLLQRMTENIAYALENFERETERRHAEEALRQSEERFRSLTQLSSDWYWEQDADFRFSRFEGRESAPTLEMLKQRYIGKRPWELGVDIECEGGWDGHRALLASHQPFRDLVQSARTPSGTRRYVSISGEPVFDAAGNFRGYRGTSRDVTERKRFEARIEHLATHDGLTGLPNRAMFSQMLNLAISSARRYGRGFAVLFVDLDGFKAVNDSLGHAAGDALLKQVSERMRECLRASDLVARMGGDEFVVLLQDSGGIEEVASVTRKILLRVGEPVELGAETRQVTASVGISLYPSDAQDEQALMKHADTAMYIAKEAGKNNFRFFAGQAAAG